MKNKTSKIFELNGNKMLPMSWAYNDKRYIVEDVFSETIIEFLPTKDEFNSFCRDTKLQSNNIYLCTDPYNLFIYYDKFIYMPLPILNSLIIKAMKVDEHIISLKSIHKKCLNRENYIKLFDTINPDIRLDLLLSKYFSIPKRQRIVILQKELKEKAISINDIPVDVVKDLCDGFDRSIIGEYMVGDNPDILECYCVKNEVSDSWNSIWCSVDSALSYSNKNLDDASIYSCSIDRENISVILNDRILLKSEKILINQKISDSIKQLTKADILRGGYKSKCKEIIEDTMYSIDSLSNFFTDDVFSSSHAKNMLQLGLIQGAFCKFSYRDLNLLGFVLGFTGLCLEQVDSLENPSDFLDSIYLTNYLPTGDRKIAKYIIDSFVLENVDKTILLDTYNINDVERVDSIRDLYLDIIQLSQVESDSFDEQSLKLRTSRRFISLWKNRYLT